MGKRLFPKEYRAWQNMKNRCYNQKCEYYHDYGGRGIVVCDRWKDSFSLFMEDVGQAPSKDHSLERDDVNGVYEPGNARWATTKEQSLNKRNTAKLTVDGVEKPIMTWCEIYGISEKTVRSRIKAGIDVKTALTTPAQKSRFQNGHKRMYNKKFNKFELNGESKTLFEWCKIYNMPYDLVYHRVHSGMDVSIALTKEKNIHSQKFSKPWQKNKI